MNGSHPFCGPFYPPPPFLIINQQHEQLKLGEIKPGQSYVPSGLTAKQYAELRSKEAKKKAENYERNVKKAGVFLGYDEFYLKRGTDLDQAWKKDPNLGHRMAKVSLYRLCCFIRL
jgi:hypothetical protein